MFNPDDFIKECKPKETRLSQITLVRNQLDKWHDNRDDLKERMKEKEHQNKYNEYKLKIFDRIIEKLATQLKEYETTGKIDSKKICFLARKYIDYAKSKKWIITPS